MFFFEKKNQKTFATLCARLLPRHGLEAAQEHACHQLPRGVMAQECNILLRGRYGGAKQTMQHDRAAPATISTFMLYSNSCGPSLAAGAT
jgi:hypothetical protein